MGTRKGHPLRVALRHEALESRAMLASVVGDSPWQNPLDENDLNFDGAVSPGDALVAINAINAGAGGELAAKFAPPMLDGRLRAAAKTFLDVDGDGHLAAGDALRIINTINQRLGRPPVGEVPSEDAVPDDLENAQVLELKRGFAKVRGWIDADGDVDVFQITAVRTDLNVALFSAGGGEMTVRILDASGEEVASATTEAGSRRPAKADAEVTVGEVYYLEVSGGADVTGLYGLAVLNFDISDFPPAPPPGADVGDTPDAAQELALSRGHVRVHSQIDAAGDIDVFKLTASEGQLVVESHGEVELDVTITDGTGQPLQTIVARPHVIVANVAAGAYYITVKAASETATGAYHLNFANVQLPPPDDGPRHLPRPLNIYARLDADASGSVSLAEFKAGVPLGRTRLADHVFANWDKDDSGTLSLEEFVKGLANFPSLIPNADEPASAPGPVTTT